VLAEVFRDPDHPFSFLSASFSLIKPSTCANFSEKRPCETGFLSEKSARTRPGARFKLHLEPIRGRQA
jgi:hypothetical protein